MKKSKPNIVYISLPNSKHFEWAKKSLNYKYNTVVDKPITSNEKQLNELIELSKKIKKVTHYNGELKFDKSKPDGMRLKVLDISRIKKINWKPKISLEQGLDYTYKFFTSEKKYYEKIKK